MADGATQGMDVELEELDDLLEQTSEPPFPRGNHRRLGECLELESEDWTEPDKAGSAIALKRSIRTITPLIVADALALSLTGLLTQVALLWAFPHAALQGSFAAPVALMPLLLAYWMSALYSEIWVHPVVEFRAFSHINTLALFAAAGAGVLAPPLWAWCLTAWLFSLALVPLPRMMIRHCFVNSNWWGFHTVVIGSGQPASKLVDLLLDVPRSGLRPVILSDPEDICRSAAVPVVNDPATLASMLRNLGIRHAVVSLPECSVSQMSEILDRYSRLVPHLLVLSDASTLPTLWGASRSCGRISGIEVRNHLLMVTLQKLKRLADVSIALTGLTLGIPVIIAVAIMVKATSPGPIFFGHGRIGRSGRRFKAWKFRSMYVNGDRLLREYLARNPDARKEWDRDQKLRHDPRISPIGKFLRISSLDEIPQLWNVLRGDMSLVGPRPIVDSEVIRYGEAFRQYTTVKPGITGLWQVSGRSDVSYDDRVRLDQFYVRHWSLWLDVYILAKTLVALMNRRGAC